MGAFLRDLAKTFSLFADAGRFHELPIYWDDRQALRADWVAVGDDLRKALGKEKVNGTRDVSIGS